MDISGSLVWLKVWPWNSSRLGPSWKGATGRETPSVERDIDSTLKNSCIFSWERECGERTGLSFSIMSSTPTIILWSPSERRFIKYYECVCEIHNLAKYLPRPLKRWMSMIKNIWSSAKNISPRMIFELWLGKAFQYTCRMKWKTKTITIIPLPRNNGVASCPPWRQQITESKMWLK